MAAADFEKLLQNMKRANDITARAASDAAKHATIMDNFEKRLDLNSASVAKLEEYEKLMAEMDKVGDNGGPALTTTFPSTATSPPPAAQGGGSTVASTHITGDPEIIRGRFHITGRQI